MKIAILSSGFESKHIRLQPQRTLIEMGLQLASLRHTVSLISDGAAHLPVQDELWGLAVHRLPSLLSFRGRSNPELISLLDRESPDIILWHLGVSSFYHQSLCFSLSRPTVGVITSPAHTALEIMRLAPVILSTNIDLFAYHIAAALVPRAVIRRPFARGGLSGAVTLSETTRRFLVRKGAPVERLWAIAPGVDEPWLDDSAAGGIAREDLRRRLGLEEDDFVIAYFGSLAPIRGVFTLLEAVRRAVSHHPRLHLLVLARRHDQYWKKETVRLNNLVNQDGLSGHVQVVDEFLSQADLIQHLAASDAVCLPFEVLPSDVPLSILEAMALGKAVITTNVSSIPEIVGEDRGFLVPPASISALEQQLGLVMDAPAEAIARGQRARRYVHTHRTWAHMGKTLNEVLEKVAYAKG